MRTEAEIRATYRVVSEPSWRVEHLHRGKWVVVIYCGSEVVANASLEKHVANAVRWESLTPQERIREVLR